MFPLLQNTLPAESDVPKTSETPDVPNNKPQGESADVTDITHNTGGDGSVGVTNPSIYLHGADSDLDDDDDDNNKDKNDKNETGGDGETTRLGMAVEHEACEDDMCLIDSAERKHVKEPPESQPASKRAKVAKVKTYPIAWRKLLLDILLHSDKNMSIVQMVDALKIHVEKFKCVPIADDILKKQVKQFVDPSNQVVKRAGVRPIRFALRANVINLANEERADSTQLTAFVVSATRRRVPGDVRSWQVNASSIDEAMKSLPGDLKMVPMYVRGTEADEVVVLCPYNMPVQTFYASRVTALQYCDVAAQKASAGSLGFELFD